MTWTDAQEIEQLRKLIKELIAENERLRKYVEERYESK